MSIIVAGVIFILLLYLIRLDVRFKPEQLSRIQEEALLARKKYKSIIVDTVELPEAKAGEMVISLDSLSELVKAADTLFKPVLHQAGADKHTYCVIDGLTRYEYVTTLRLSDNWDEYREQVWKLIEEEASKGRKRE